MDHCLLSWQYQPKVTTIAGSLLKEVTSQSKLGNKHDTYVAPIGPYTVKSHANQALNSPPAHHGTCTVGEGLARKLPAARWDERTRFSGRQAASIVPQENLYIVASP